MKTRLLRKLRKIASEHVYFQCTEHNLDKYVIVFDNSDSIAGHPTVKFYCGIDSQHRVVYDISYIYSVHAFDLNSDAIKCLMQIRREFIQKLVNVHKEMKLAKERQIHETLFSKEMEKRNKWLRRL